nr:hypothetical protein [Tanacetum cinerariifolium]
MLPKNNELPTSTYQAKKLMCPLGSEVKRIDACLKDCILYRNGYKDLHKCPVCKVSRYNDTTLTEFEEHVIKNGPGAKVLWYLPIIPRLKQSYSNSKNEKLLRWHAEGQKNDEKIRHVADASQWKNIDNYYTKFGAEIRNIRFGLSSDEINPFENISSRQSTWPDPKQPGNDIDVYLEPLIDDMIDLWDKGVKVYDAYKKERFKLFAKIFCTISDFSACGNLSGYGTKGDKACSICEKYTHSRWLTNWFAKHPCNKYCCQERARNEKKTTKAPIEQSKDEKEKADIRKRLHLLKDDIDDRSDAVKKGYQQWMAREDCAMPQLVNFKKEIFRDADDFTLPINPTYIIELLTFEKIRTNILTLFSRSLYLFMETSPNNKTGFLNPEVITEDTHMDTYIDVEIYMTKALKGYDFFVAPYLHKQDGDSSWILLSGNQGKPRKTTILLNKWNVVKGFEIVVLTAGNNDNNNDNPVKKWFQRSSSFTLLRP